MSHNFFFLSRTFITKKAKSFHLHNEMKLKYTVLAASVTISSAWVPNLCFSYLGSHTLTKKDAWNRSLRHFADFSLQSAVAPTEETVTPAALKPTGKAIAEGS